MNFSEKAVKAAAAAIANSRGGRRGVPPITNILDLLPAKLLEDVMEDARAAIEAAELESNERRYRALVDQSWRVEEWAKPGNRLVQQVIDRQGDVLSEDECAETAIDLAIKATAQ